MKKVLLIGGAVAAGIAIEAGVIYCSYLAGTKSIKQSNNLGYDRQYSNPTPLKKKPIGDSYTYHYKWNTDGENPIRVFSDRLSVESILEDMSMILRDFQEVTVADFKSILGEASLYPETLKGWKDLTSAEIMSNGEGYMLCLPPVEKFS